MLYAVFAMIIINIHKTILQKSRAYIIYFYPVNIYPEAGKQRLLPGLAMRPDKRERGPH